MAEAAIIEDILCPHCDGKILAKGIYVWVVETLDMEKNSSMSIRAICTTEKIAQRYIEMFRSELDMGNRYVTTYEKVEINHGFGFVDMQALMELDAFKRQERGEIKDQKFFDEIFPSKQWSYPRDGD